MTLAFGADSSNEDRVSANEMLLVSKNDVIDESLMPGSKPLGQIIGKSFLLAYSERVETIRYRDEFSKKFGVNAISTLELAGNSQFHTYVLLCLETSIEVDIEFFKYARLCPTIRVLHTSDQLISTKLFLGNRRVRVDRRMEESRDEEEMENRDDSYMYNLLLLAVVSISLASWKWG